VIRWRFYEPGPAGDFLEHFLRDPQRWRESPRGQPMPLNVYDEGSDLVVEALLPGVRPEDVEVGFADGVLTIEANLEVGEHDFQHQEFRSSRFFRQLGLPSDTRVDDATASSENGVLTVRVPKRKPKQPERIRIEVARNPAGATAIDAKPGEDYKEVPRSPRRKKASGP
jgi:HSP20 family protein